MLAWGILFRTISKRCAMAVTTGPEGYPPPDGAVFHLGWEFAPPKYGAWYLQQGRGGVQHLFWLGPANKLNRGLTEEIKSLMQTQPSRPANIHNADAMPRSCRVSVASWSCTTSADWHRSAIMWWMTPPVHCAGMSCRTSHASKWSYHANC
jgi:hypothetical protein